MGLQPSKMMDVTEDRDVWRLNLELLPRNPHGKTGNKEEKKEATLISVQKTQSFSALHIAFLSFFNVFYTKT